MANGDEHHMAGGLTDPDDGSRTDVLIVQNGPARNSGTGVDGRVTADLKFVTGNGVFTVVNVTTGDLRTLAAFLVESAGELERQDGRGRG